MACKSCGEKINLLIIKNKKTHKISIKKLMWGGGNFNQLRSLFTFKSAIKIIFFYFWFAYFA